MHVVVVISKNESTFQCYKLWENNQQTACHVFQVRPSLRISKKENIIII